MLATVEAVFAMAIPVFIACAESNSAKIRNDCAIPVVATPLSLTVIPPETNVKTDDARGDNVCIGCVQIDAATEEFIRRIDEKDLSRPAATCCKMGQDDVRSRR